MPQLSMVYKSKVIKGFSPTVFWAYSLVSEGGIIILWYNQMAYAFGTKHSMKMEIYAKLKFA